MDIFMVYLNGTFVQYVEADNEQEAMAEVLNTNLAEMSGTITLELLPI